MEMIVHLHPEIFSLVGEGIKDVEVRVNDEKRRKLKIGDTLLFVNRDNEEETIRVEVMDLLYYPSFEAVAEAFPMERLYKAGVSVEDYLALMNSFYSEEEVKKYGIVAIKFRMD